MDNFCCYVRPGEVLLSWCDDQADPNYSRCREALAVLERETDARGRTFKVHRIVTPGPLFASEDECRDVDACLGTQPRRAGERLAASYVNFLIVNGGIIAPTFGVPEDAEALRTLQACFPEHEVVQVPGREILLGGGNIHCITQQQPTGR